MNKKYFSFTKILFCALVLISAFSLLDIKELEAYDDVSLQITPNNPTYGSGESVVLSGEIKIQNWYPVCPKMHVTPDTHYQGSYPASLSNMTVELRDTSDNLLWSQVINAGPDYIQTDWGSEYACNDSTGEGAESAYANESYLGANHYYIYGVTIPVGSLVAGSYYIQLVTNATPEGQSGSCDDFYWNFNNGANEGPPFIAPGGLNNCNGSTYNFDSGMGFTFPYSLTGATCDIVDFSADDENPPYNTGTTLRFSLNGPFAWDISLLGGSVVPIPDSGTGSDTASTGNLTTTHTYRLTCGSHTWDKTVIPQGQGDGAQFISQSVPSSMTPGQVQSVSITMANIGASTWTQSGGMYMLGSENPRDNTIWGTGGRASMDPADSIAPGQSKTFTFDITAPTNPTIPECASTTLPTTCNFQWRMLHGADNGPFLAGWFGELTQNIAITVNASFDAAQFISQSAPASMSAGSTQSVSVIMKNIGNTNWTQSGGQYALGSFNAQDNTIWGPAGRVPLTGAENIAPLQQKTFTFTVTAPTVATITASAANTSTCASTTLPTTCNFQWKMVHDAANGSLPAAWFDSPSANLSITVTAPVAPVPSGTLSATSCTIPNGQATCNSVLNWTTSDLTANPTEVTRNNPANTHISWLTSGTNVNSAVGPGTYTYFLYHNSALLAQSSPITADCAPGNSWNAGLGSCQLTPVNGSCGSSNNSCIAGTLQDTADTPTFYLWNCNGINGGANISCSESKGPGPGGPAVCGDGLIGGSEQCDNGALNNDSAASCPGHCSTSCTLLNSCPLAQCGDNIPGNSAGEQCDRGSANGSCPIDCSISCRTNTCQKQPFFQEN